MNDHTGYSKSTTVRSSCWLFSLVVPATIAWAQPTLYATNHIPVAGTYRAVCLAPMTLPEPPGGNGATWDFSWLDLVPDDTLWYTAAFGDVVAYHANWSVFERYIGLDTAGLYDAGYDNYYCQMAMNRLLLPDTLGLGDEVNDDFGASCWYTSDDPPLDLLFNENGTNQLVADGWGTLVMPWGTVENVIRTTTVWASTLIQSSPAIPLEYRQDITEYWHEGVAEPVVRIRHRRMRPVGSTNWNEEGHQVEYIIEIGLGQVERRPMEFALAPNPTPDRATLYSASPMLGPITIQVFDLSGRLVGSAPAVGPALQGGVVVNLESLTPGQYMLRVADRAGQTGRVKVLKQ